MVIAFNVPNKALLNLQRTFGLQIGSGNQSFFQSHDAVFLDESKQSFLLAYYMRIL